MVCAFECAARPKLRNISRRLSPFIFRYDNKKSGFVALILFLHKFNPIYPRLKNINSCCQSADVYALCAFD